MEIEKEELDLIVDQQMEMNNMLKQIGLLESEKSRVLKFYSDLLTESNKTKKGLEEKYGAINIDLSDGSYTPIEKKD
jgi:hypothetical protein